MSETINGTQALPAMQEPPARRELQVSDRGLSLRSMEDMWRFATAVSKSGLAPKGIETPEAILVALQMGAELGLTPMASLQNIAVINGRPSVWGDAMLAVCRGSGLFDEESFDETISGAGQTMAASCTVRRLPRGKPVVRTFSMDDAKLAGLAGKQGPWSQYPKRMLQMRARSWALRDGFADVLRGFRSVEEARDIIDVESEPPRGGHSKATRSPMADELSKPANGHDTPADASATTPAEAKDAVNADLKPKAGDYRAHLKTILPTAQNATDVKAMYAAAVDLFKLADEEDLHEADVLCTDRMDAIKAGRGARSNKQPAGATA